MGLIGNRFRNSTGVHRALGDLPAYMVPRQYSDWCYTRSQTGATTVLAGLASPQGSYGPASWFPPQVNGEMAMRADATGDLSADLIPSRAMSIDMTGSGDLDAIGALAIAMAIAMTGDGDLTATIEGRLNASIDMTGSGDLTASMSGLGNMVIAMLGDGGLEATVAAYGNMEIDIVVTGTGLTTGNVGQAVWSALAAVNDDPGTMGALLNAAGAGGDPWAVTLEGSYTAADLLRIVSSVLAGKVSGMELNAPVFRSVDDAEDRVSATTTTDGNRTSVTLNGS